ncbi:hypothetical protein LINPERPRIM_LOCUS25648 [Linum perenne]
MAVLFPGSCRGCIVWFFITIWCSHCYILTNY